MHATETLQLGKYENWAFVMLNILVEWDRTECFWPSVWRLWRCCHAYLLVRDLLHGRVDSWGGTLQSWALWPAVKQWKSMNQLSMKILQLLQCDLEFYHMNNTLVAVRKDVLHWNSFHFNQGSPANAWSINFAFNFIGILLLLDIKLAFILSI